MKRSTGCGRNGRTCCGVRNDGVPIVGFTWYSLTDQMDWDTALREENGRVNPLGLYDLDRNIRPVGTGLSSKLIADWCDVLPTQSVCLILPLTLPQEFVEEPEVPRHRDQVNLPTTAIRPRTLSRNRRRDNWTNGALSVL